MNNQSPASLADEWDSGRSGYRYLFTVAEKMAAELRRLDSIVRERDELKAKVEALEKLSVTKVMIDVVPGSDGMGHEVYAKSVDELCEHMGKIYEELGDWQLGIRRHSSDTHQAQSETHTFQQRVKPWLVECFGEAMAFDRQGRSHRFLEEALELVQSAGCTASEAHQLVDYTFGRPIGEPSQEVGGVMVTLAALCLANGLDMHANGETELARVNEPATLLKIRAKQKAKPQFSPLPEEPPVVKPDVKAAASRLMGWKLPDNFSPDGYITFDREGAKAGNFWPVGTNLLTCSQAEDMLNYALGVRHE